MNNNLSDFAPQKDNQPFINSDPLADQSSVAPIPKVGEEVGEKSQEVSPPPPPFSSPTPAVSSAPDYTKPENKEAARKHANELIDQGKFEEAAKILRESGMHQTVMPAPPASAAGGPADKPKPQSEQAIKPPISPTVSSPTPSPIPSQFPTPAPTPPPQMPQETPSIPNKEPEIKSEPTPQVPPAIIPPQAQQKPSQEPTPKPQPTPEPAVQEPETPASAMPPPLPYPA